MLEVKNLSFGYGLKKPLFQGLSLQIPEGSRVWFSAPSGTGKTTLLRLLLGLEKPRRGSVLIPAGTSFSTVFQEDRLLPWKTVLENVALFSDEETAAALLGELGIAEAAGQLPEELSGGMRRRATLARALAHPFDVLVLDEAFTGLDAQAKAVCLAAVEKRLAGKTLLLVSHDPQVAEVLGAVRTEIGNA